MANRRIKKTAHYNSLVKSAFAACAVLAFSLIVGILGYHYFFKIGWIDSLVNASMILTGMGPVDRAETDGAKIFSAVYAIYSGVAFLTSVAVILSPGIHQFLRRFHIDMEDDN